MLLNLLNFAKFSNKCSKFLTKNWDCRALQRSALCRSRRELSNAYLLAKFGFDTAENELCKVCPTLSVAEPRISLQSWRRAQEELVYAVSVKAPSLGRRTSRILTSAHQHDWTWLNFNDECHESFKVVNTRQLFQSKKYFSYTVLFCLKLSTSVPNDS